MALALKFRGIKVDYFEDAVRNDPGWAALAAKFEITRAARDRPALSEAAAGAGHGDDRARASSCGRPTRRWARGWCRSTTTGLKAKFHRPGRAGARRAKAQELAQRLWDIDQAADVTPLVEALAKP